MKKSLKVEINAEVLKKIRESSGYTVDEVAQKLKVSVDKIKKVEEGRDSFTLTQIKKLADIYHRPLAIFFTDTAPDMPTIPDYRINREKRLTPEVYRCERRAYYLSNKLRELTDKRSRIPQFDDMKPDELARKFRGYLGIELIKGKKTEELLDYYKAILEEKLWISIIELPLKADDVRGFSILKDIAVIVLNEEDNPSIKLFTLFHEVYHLIKNTSGICTVEIEGEKEDFERNADLFSAEFLVPLDDLREECKKFSQLDEEAISQIVRVYGVSKQVIMLRLLQLGCISIERYNQFKLERNQKLDEMKGKGLGRRNWEKVFKNRVGNLVLREISNAYHEDKIAYSEVFDILSMKTKYIEKLLE